MPFSIRRLLVPALVLATAGGCQTWGKKKCDTCPPPPPPGAQIITPPPGGSYGVPPGGTILPPASPPPGAPGVAAPPPPSFPSGASYPPVASYYGSPEIRLGVPDSIAKTPAIQLPEAKTPLISGTVPSLRLLPPEFGSATTAPAAPTMTPATPTMPVGIVDFAPALPEAVAGGRKPSLDGLDWLKTSGYKLVVLLRRPGESDAADRRQIESRGMTFVSLEVSPATLTPATVAEFSKLVGDSASQPMFVYDADGSLSGGLWYLYFRKVEKLSDEAARLRAIRLGLKESADGPHLEMWLAVQKVMATGS